MHKVDSVCSLSEAVDFPSFSFSMARTFSKASLHALVSGVLPEEASSAAAIAVCTSHGTQLKLWQRWPGGRCVESNYSLFNIVHQEVSCASHLCNVLSKCQTLQQNKQQLHMHVTVTP